MAWKIALVALALTAGADTPLPFAAINADTGDSMLTWADYEADINHCVSYELEPGIYNPIEGCVWLVVWVPGPTGVNDEHPALPASPCTAGSCGKLFSWR